MVISRVAADDDDCSSSLFMRLPDDIVLDILRKITDLKTLCVCKVVCKHFFSTLQQVDMISYTASAPLIVVEPKSNNDDISSLFWFKSMKEYFRCVKSLRIQLPSSLGQGIDYTCLSKWKVKFSNTRLDTFIFLSPNSIFDRGDNVLLGNIVDPGLLDRGVNVEVQELQEKFTKVWMCCGCLGHFEKLYKMSMGCIMDLPLLEKICITDSSKRGRVSFSGRQITEFRNFVSPETANRINHIEFRTRRCYLPSLELPISRYVMKEVTLILVERKVIFMSNIVDEENDCENKEEAAYTEAMVEIFKKHSSLLEIIG